MPRWGLKGLPKVAGRIESTMAPVRTRARPSSSGFPRRRSNMASAASEAIAISRAPTTKPAPGSPSTLVGTARSQKPRGPA